MTTSDRVAQLYPQASGSLFVAFCNWQGYGGYFNPPSHGGIDGISTKNTQLDWNVAVVQSGLYRRKILLLLVHFLKLFEKDIYTVADHSGRAV
jgi:hypothetical protein